MNVSHDGIGTLHRHLLVALLLSALSACGGGTSAPPAETSGPESSTLDPTTATPDSEPSGSQQPEIDEEAAPEPEPESEPEESPVERAIRTGDASQVVLADDLLDATLASVETGRTLHLDTLVQLFNLSTDGTARADGTSLTAIDWNPTHDAATLIPTFGENTALLYTNSVTDSEKTVYSKSIGVIGQRDARYLVLGSNPMRNHRRNPESLNAQMHQLLQNSMRWLTNEQSLTSVNITIAHMDNGYYFPDEQGVREWLDEFYPDIVSYNDAATCDDDALSSCLTDQTDLLIISQHMNETTDADTVANFVSSAMRSGTPVMYLHHDGGLSELGAALMQQFDVTYEWDNYWKKLQLQSFDARETLNQLPTDITSVQTMLRHLRAGDFSFEWSACSGENCGAVTGLDTEMQEGADTVRSMMNGLDTAKRNLFEEPGYRLQKLLALSGDHLRQSITYPMDKLTTDDNTLMRAWFADHAVYNYRNINPAQADLGNFSRSDFSHVTPIDKTVSLTSKRNFRSAGVYALPGKTVEVTRTDNSDVEVKVFVNTQRSGSTHQWAEDGYSRPKYLQSPHIPVASGETIRFTTPYGGPLQIAFSSNDLPVTLQFKNVGQHPYWSGPEHDTSFATQLAAGDYDWAELVTPGFEVHSSLEKMRSSVADEKWGTAEALAAGTMRYLHNFPHVLAGFQGPGIDVVEEIHSFADQNNYDIDLLDLVKHMNADQATCGYGCSGNPYDAYWSFSPVGHGDVHELGHGLERYRLRFAGWELHTMTNPYSYYTKTQFYKTTGADPECQSLPFEANFNILQASINTDDPAAYVKANLWDMIGWSRGAAMFIQMMMSAQDHGALQDGWHLLARLHIMEREFNRAIKLDDEGWQAKRDSLGMGQYTRTQADALTQNDWLLIAVSYATQLDHRDYFDMWALPYSDAAASQVSALALPANTRKYYISSDTGYCKGEGFDGNSVVVDGVESWPAAN